MKDNDRIAKLPFALIKKLEEAVPSLKPPKAWQEVLGGESLVEVLDRQEIISAAWLAAYITHEHYQATINALTQANEHLKQPRPIHIVIERGGFWSWLRSRKTKNENKTHPD